MITSQQLDKKKNKKKGRAIANSVPRIKHEKTLDELEQARKKWHEAIKEIKKIQQSFKVKLAEKVKEMTLKIRHAQTAGFEAAQKLLEKEQVKKEIARQKFIEAAQAKFEKSYNKKLNRKIESSKLTSYKNNVKPKTKTKAKKKTNAVATMTVTSAKNSTVTKRRGRPAKRKNA